MLFAEPVSIDTDGDTADDIIVQVSYSGNIVALDASTGDKRWAFKIQNKIQAAPSVIVIDRSIKLLIADTEGAVYIVDVADGGIEMSVKIEHADRFVVAPVVRRLAENGPVYAILTSLNGNVFAYDLGAN